MIDKNKSEFISFSIFLLIIISIYGVSTFQRNSYWTSELTLWEDAQLKSPSKSRPYTYAGIAYAKEKRMKEAYQRLSKAVFLNPNDIEAKYNLSILYMELGRFDLAEVELKKAIKSRPELIESYLALVDLYTKTNQSKEAASILKEAISRWPNNIRLRMKLATTNAMRGEINAAIRDYKWILARVPMETEALNGLGNIYMLRKKPALALSYYKSSIKLRPSDPVPIYNAALVSEELGEYEKAAEFYALFIKTALTDKTRFNEAIKNAKKRIAFIKSKG